MYELNKNKSNVFTNNEYNESLNCCVCFSRLVTLSSHYDKNDLEKNLTINADEFKTCDACSNLLIELKAYNGGMPYNQFMRIFKN